MWNVGEFPLERERKIRLRLAFFINCGIRHFNFTSQSCSDGKEMYKKVWCTCKVVVLLIKPIECFHSRGQHLCKFIGTKDSLCTRKEFNSHRTGFGHQHGRRFIVLGHWPPWRHVKTLYCFFLPFSLPSPSSLLSSLLSLLPRLHQTGFWPPAKKSNRD